MLNGRVAKSLSALGFSTVWTRSVSVLFLPQIRDHRLCTARRESVSSTPTRCASAVYVPRDAGRDVRCRALSRPCRRTGMIVCICLTHWSPKGSTRRSASAARLPASVNKPSPWLSARPPPRSFWHLIVGMKSGLDIADH